MPQSYYITVHKASKQDYFDLMLCSNFVTLVHHIKKPYYIEFFGHEVTNFNARTPKYCFFRKTAKLNFQFWRNHREVAPDTGKSKPHI